MSKQIVFVDDSGNPGFEGAVSANLIMAGVVFDDAGEATRANKLISDFRKSLGWSDNVEFKFRKTSKDHVCELLRRLVGDCNFQVYGVYINKASYRQVSPLLDSEKLYNWTIKELLMRMPLREANVVMDGRSTKEYQRRVTSYLRHEVNGAKYRMKSFQMVDSRRDNLIQLADLAAGSIGRSLQPDKTDSGTYIKILRSKIANIESL